MPNNDNIKKMYHNGSAVGLVEMSSGGVPIPSGLESMELDNFGNITKISIKSDGDYKYSTHTLSSVTFTGDSTTIPVSAFTSCSGITEIIMSDNIIELKDNAFSLGSSANPIKNIRLSNNIWRFGVNSLPTSYFNYSASTYDLDNNVFYLDGKMAFYNSSTATTSIREGTLYMYNTFNYSHTSASTVSLPSTLKVIGCSSFYSCNKLTSIDIPNSVVSIGYAAFTNCSGLTSVTIGSSVIEIEENAFMGCKSLTSINIPDSTTKIGAYCFQSCQKLNNINVGSGVTEIGSSAFYGVATSTNKPTYTFRSLTPPAVTYGGFLGTLNNITAIYVPAESVDAYKSATGWSEYASKIQATPS